MLALVNADILGTKLEWTEKEGRIERTFSSPVPGKNSPYLWKLTVMTLSVV